MPRNQQRQISAEAHKRRHQRIVKQRRIINAAAKARNALTELAEIWPKNRDELKRAARQIEYHIRLDAVFQRAKLLNDRTHAQPTP